MPTLKRADRTLYYTDSGGDGPVVVFAHGFLMDHRMFAAQVDALGEAYRVVTYDSRGFGQSTWDGEAFDFYDEADDCVALLDHLGVDKATIAGMSRGGYMALRMALAHPERVQALVLISTRGPSDVGELRAIYRQTRDTWRDAGPVEPLIEGLAGGILGPEDMVGDAWDVWLPRWRAYDRGAVVAGMDAMIDRDEIADRLGEITCPALVIHGDADLGVPFENGELLAEKLPGATGLVRVEGGTHVAVMVHADVVEAPLRAFLDAHAG